MLKAQKNILALLLALFVIASFGTASANQQTGGMMTNNGVPLPLDVNGFQLGLSVNLDNFINPAGLGDVLLYNYYNARGGMQTYFTVVNTSSSNGQRVRVRFREAADIEKSACPNNSGVNQESRGSYEILDFDICLSANDMWSGFITAGANGGAKLCTLDTDTFVYDGADGAHVFPAGCVPFKFGAENGKAGGKITADNTMEGYFEMIGERSLIAEPESCWPERALHADSPDIIGSDVPNVLFGNAAMISTLTGATYTYNATAIADFNFADITESTFTELPNLDASAGDGLRGVNYILMKEHLYSVYDLSNAGTAFVITAPTKALTQTCGATSDIFDDTRVRFGVWDDKENSPQTSCSFSPCSLLDNTLPYEVNVLTLNNSKIVSSTVAQNISTSFTFGWFDLNLNPVPVSAPALLTPAHQIVTIDSVRTITNRGWPVLGLTLLDVNNDISTGAFVMQHRTNITETLFIVPIL